LRHLGVDLDAPVGTPVYAVAAGEVVAVGGPEQHDGWGLGNYALFVRHDSDRGPFVALYGHVRTRLTVGDAVAAGAVIAEIGVYEEVLDDGSTATYPSHLHFGVHPGAAMPTGATGLALDPYCDGGNTRGWVAPIAFLRGGS
jgi:murein DD-endopeptidase MepM/ murein hydrolase activator NlpD